MVRGGRFAGVLAFPLAVVMVRDYIELRKKLKHPKRRSIDEVLATPLACTATRWYRLASPVIFQIDPETAHTCAIYSGQFVGYVLSSLESVKKSVHALIDTIFGPSRIQICGSPHQSRLSILVNGLVYKSPIGISAGFDKNGRLAQFFTNSQLAAHCEVGSVSYFAWSGNPRPRVFRLPKDHAVINRMGLNNEGAEAVANRLSDISGETDGRIRLGVNITKTPDSSIEGDEAVADFAKSFQFMRFIENIDWITLNISCPNTAEGKTFEDKTALRALLTELRSIDSERRIHLKVAPLTVDQTEIDPEIFKIAKDFKVDALVVANTVPDRNFDSLLSSSKLLQERGGLSGKPIFTRSLALVREAFKNGLTVVGVGGVFSGSDAYKLIRSGASLVQLYTAMVYEGPFVFRDIENGLERHLIIDGFDNVSEVVGIDNV
jgi:dihydroorotate dehydrogenase